MKRVAIGVALWACLFIAGCAREVRAPEPAEPDPDRPGWRATSDRGLTGRLAPESGAVEVGRFQTWILELREPGGAAVTSALVSISGGMPSHGHGLPTQPQVTEEMGDGLYRIEGLKLNMHGTWVLEVRVETAMRRDLLRFDMAIDF